MKIGDFVHEYVGGPIMRVVGFLDGWRIAICEVLSSGLVRNVAVALLTVVGMLGAAAHGHGSEEPPNDPVIEKTVTTATVVASGSVAQPFGLADDGTWFPQVMTIPWNPITFLDDEGLPPRFLH